MGDAEEEGSGFFFVFIVKWPPACASGRGPSLIPLLWAPSSSGRFAGSSSAFGCSSGGIGSPRRTISDSTLGIVSSASCRWCSGLSGLRRKARDWKSVQSSSVAGFRVISCRARSSWHRPLRRSPAGFRRCGKRLQTVRQAWACSFRWGKRSVTRTRKIVQLMEEWRKRDAGSEICCITLARRYPGVRFRP